METLRACADAHNGKRDYLGAIAGGVFDDSVKNLALKSGFYALEQSGDAMSVAAVPESWDPKRWRRKKRRAGRPRENGAHTPLRR
ncbi:MAG: hypothetical protein LBG43_04035 [Treponema sp.]|jgi:hypothetical protein|nr:hypothetical protein [Treponema sp.]